MSSKISIHLQYKDTYRHRVKIACGWCRFIPNSVMLEPDLVLSWDNFIEANKVMKERYLLRQDKPIQYTMFL